MSKRSKFGARIYFYPETGTILVKQTVSNAPKSVYVIDKDKQKNLKHKERHADWKNYKKIAQAVRAAVLGKLKA